ncbi:NfeD family protein [Nereida sp. NH-UV-3]|uniref:NfeD family protein n=1 Tax=Nereida TaxID=282198 RepID=UPI0036F1E278
MDALANTWWAWAAFALVLAILEVLAPGFVLLGFAIGAALVSVLVWLNVGLSLIWLSLLFAVASLVAWLVLRSLFQLKTGQVRTFDEDINS